MKDVTNRTLKCRCGNIIDRDYNSAINLLKFGETVVYNKTPNSWEGPLGV